jgi:hypothetical protein
MALYAGVLGWRDEWRERGVPCCSSMPCWMGAGFSVGSRQAAWHSLTCIYPPELYLSHKTHMAPQLALHLPTAPPETNCAP